METWRHSISICTWRHGDIWKHAVTPWTYYLEDKEIYKDTPCPYKHRKWRHMETWRPSISINTWRYKESSSPCPHGHMETLHVHIHMETCRHSTWRHMETWRHSMSIFTWKHKDTRRHGKTSCTYPHGDMQTLYVHIHMETWRHSTWRQKETCRHSMSIST